MKVIIQHNWTSGLGDLYCCSTEYLNFVYQLKSIGYETKLIFSFNGRSGGNKFIGLNKFEDIFDLESFVLFDEIQVNEYPICDLNYEGTKYIHTQYGPREPGHHWWDVFIDVLPEGIGFPSFNPHSFLYESKIPLVLPKFNSEVYKREKKFINNINSDYNFLHFRYLDYTFITDELKIWVENLKNSVSKYEGKIHLGSNNQYCLETIGRLENVHTYKFKNLDLFSNDHCYYFYNKHITNDMLLDRLYDNIAEMVSLQNAKKIFQMTSYSWISNFVFYGIANSKSNLQLQNININDINLI